VTLRNDGQTPHDVVVAVMVAAWIALLAVLVVTAPRRNGSRGRSRAGLRLATEADT
jgi:hypothetical protein